MSKTSKYFILYVAISFFGWLWETVYMYFSTGYFHDRGFLTLPLCPIYATVLMSIYFLLGTTKEEQGILKGIRSPLAKALIYLCLAFIIPTVAELLVGAFFDHILNVRLWDYSNMDYNTGGYIALEISVLWGLAIFIFMNKIFLPIKNLIFKIPKSVCYVTSAVFIIAIAADVINILINM